VQRGHQEIAGAAGAVAGEHAAGPVRAVRRGRESNNDEARARITEAGNRPRSVRDVPERAPLLASDPLAVLAQARAALAGDDRLANIL